jgi:hypothetical protein
MNARVTSGLQDAALMVGPVGADKRRYASFHRSLGRNTPLHNKRRDWSEIA